MENILIVEDTASQQRAALEAFPHARLATTLDSALKEIKAKRPDCVLSDLYIPSGLSSKGEMPFRDTLLMKLRTFIEDNYSLGGPRTAIVGHTLSHVSESWGLENEDTFLELFKEDPVLNFPEIKDAIKRGRRNFEEKKHYDLMHAQMERGYHQMPYGVFVVQECLTRDIPCITVTSSYHHGPEFEPFASMIKQYVDKLVDGKKPWREAYEQLVQRTPGLERMSGAHL